VAATAAFVDEGTAERSGIIEMPEPKMSPIALSSILEAQACCGGGNCW